MSFLKCFSILHARFPFYFFVLLEHVDILSNAHLFSMRSVCRLEGAVDKNSYTHSGSCMYDLGMEPRFFYQTF